MGQQVPVGDLALGRHRLTPLAGPYVHRLEAGQHAADRVVQLETAFLVEHHQRHRGERLGHGIDAHHGVWRHGQVALTVRQAFAVLVGGLAIVVDQDGGAGQTA